SLPVFAARWFGHRAHVVDCRSLGNAAVSNADRRSCRERHCYGFERGRVETNALLARQRNALEAYSGGNDRQRRCKRKSRNGFVGPRTIRGSLVPFANRARAPVASRTSPLRS